MKRLAIAGAIVAAIGVGVLIWLFFPVSGYDLPEGVNSQAPGMATRGAYLVRAAGCMGCHWDSKHGGEPFAGGRALKTPFGIFYTPNITPDPETGIGNWSDEDFVAALKNGRDPHGANLFPAFPYTSYARMPIEDMLAIKAYLFAQTPVRRENTPHDIGFPFGIRGLLTGWKALFFDNSQFEPNPKFDDAANRGAYLVDVVMHCGECHTPRNALGASDNSRYLAGSPDGAEGARVPNITPGEGGIGDWTIDDFKKFFRTGVKPDFDNSQGLMEEVIEQQMKYLTDEDILAIARYLATVDPKPNEGSRPSQ